LGSREFILYWADCQPRQFNALSAIPSSNRTNQPKVVNFSSNPGSKSYYACSTSRNAGLVLKPPFAGAFFTT